MHECPDCGQACHCSGDCEDHDTGTEFVCDCTCCLGRETDDDDDDYNRAPYDVTDPKHPDFAEHAAEKADRAKKVERGE